MSGLAAIVAGLSVLDVAVALGLLTLLVVIPVVFADVRDVTEEVWLPAHDPRRIP